MPIGTQSLQTFISTIYTSMVASTYKANIDGDTAIVSNTGGALYCYPNNPVALNVLVDPAFNLAQQGTTDPYLLNGAASPVTVSLTAPGSNSYYACVYWDLTTSTAGVVYGATAVSPTRVLPDQAWRIPLAFVLLTTGQATVVASNISDSRSPITQPFNPLATTGTISGLTQTLNCQGATSLFAGYSFTGAGFTLTLSNLRIGVPISLQFSNGNASTQTLKLAATTPAGTAYTIQAKSSTTVLNMVSTGLSMATGAVVVFAGGSCTGPAMSLIVN